MGRWITHQSNLTLFNQDGSMAYRFGDQGVLIVGDPTTRTGSANDIDSALKPTDPDKQLMRVYDTDLLGAQTVCDEMCGEGSLVSLDTTGADLPSLITGYERDYFYAPILSTTGAVESVAGIKYEVLTGSVTYESVTYNAGDVFYTVDGGTMSDCSGTYALAIPSYLDKRCDPFYTENFRIKILKNGDEPDAYWDFENHATPKGDTVTTDTDYFGWTR